MDPATFRYYTPTLHIDYELSQIELRLEKVTIGPETNYQTIQERLLKLFKQYSKTASASLVNAIFRELAHYYKALQKEQSIVRSVATQSSLDIASSPTVQFTLLFDAKINALNSAKSTEYHDKNCEWQNMLTLAAQVLRNEQLELTAIHDLQLDDKVSCMLHKAFSGILCVVPLNEYYAGCSIRQHLAYLGMILKGDAPLKFHQLAPKTIQANFLLLLATAEDNNYPDSIISLLYALPYCVNKLDWLASDGLRQSLSGSEEDISQAIRELCETFTQSSTNEEDWPTLNEVIQFLANGQISEPFEILKTTILNWMRETKPAAEDAALVTERCAQFAEGFTQVDDNAKGISCKLLDSFIAHHGLELAPVLARILGMEDSLNYSWIEKLKGLELDLLLKMANYSQSKRKVELFTYCIRPEASERCLEIAMQFAPSLTEPQTLQLLKRLSGTRLEQCIAIIRGNTFNHVTRALVFSRLQKSNLLIAVQLYSDFKTSLVQSMITKHLARLQPKNALELTENDKEVVRLLFKATWTYSENQSNAQLKKSFLKVVKKCWLEDSITESMLDQKLEAISKSSSSSGRSRTPPSLPQSLEK